MRNRACSLAALIAVLAAPGVVRAQNAVVADEGGDYEGRRGRPRYIKDWDDSQPVPYGYRKEARVRGGLVAGGAVAFGVSYGLSVGLGLLGADMSSLYGGKNTTEALFIPIAGPWIQLGQTSTASGQFLLVADGVVQLAGVSMLVAGIVAKRTILVRTDYASATLTPIATRRGAGLGITGTF